MCGIVGLVSSKPFSVEKDVLLNLKNLEYRGYDSVGYATSKGRVQKEVGSIDNFMKKIGDEKATLAISHTRWATHGGVTKINAHPHYDEKKEIFCVHNGIIENYQEIRSQLENKGYHFHTETDSEVIPIYFKSKLDSDVSAIDACRDFLQDIRGTFAVLLFIKDSDVIYALKRDSPLALGKFKDKTMIASDIYAFSEQSNEAIFFEDDEFAVVKADSTIFYNKAGKQIKKEKKVFGDLQKPEDKKDFEHFMLKEILEQPETSQRILKSLDTTQNKQLHEFIKLIARTKRLVFIAAGTSYHASLIGVFALKKVGVESHTIIASEFESFQLVDRNTLVIAISQSGETMDVVTVLKDIKKKGAKIASLVNVPYSTVQRLSDSSIDIMAGQEVAVASTKAFTNQVLVLLRLAQELGFDIDLTKISANIKKTISDNTKKIKQLADEIYEQKDIFVLGRGVAYPSAREIALKLKEVPYVHAEGMMGGELKHGTIALIEKNTPVISLIPNHNAEMISNTKEVEARGARVIVISNTDGELSLPRCGDEEFSIYACVLGHLLSYYIGLKKGCEIDKPRNLAKSVTVK